jgi:hypothetical protein
VIDPVPLTASNTVDCRESPSTEYRGLQVPAVWCSNDAQTGLRRLSVVWSIIAAIVLVPIRRSGADQSESHPITKADAQAVDVLLQRYCVDCHSGDSPEADLRLDSLARVLNQPDERITTEKIANALSSSRMPPEDAEHPTAEEHASLLNWFVVRVDAIDDKDGGSGRRTFNRRLTNEEYNYTMQSLFGVDAEFADLLIADPLAESGYRNDVRRFGFSSLQWEAYLDCARRSVGRYVQVGEHKPATVHYHIELEDLWYSTADRYKTRQRAPQPVDVATFVDRQKRNRSSKPKYVDPLAPRLPGAWSEDEALREAIPKLNQQYVAIPKRPAVGEMVVRVRAAGAADRLGRFPRMRVEAGIALGDGCSVDKRLLGDVDVAASREHPRVYEFRIRLEDVPTKGPLSDEESFDRLSVFDMDHVYISNIACDDRAIFGLGRGGHKDPSTGSTQIAEPLRSMADAGAGFLYLDCLEIEMHAGVGAEEQPYRWQVRGRDDENAPTDETAAVSELLRRLMREAYRRPVSDAEIEIKRQLFSRLRSDDYSFADSCREMMAAVLVSPSFLLLQSGRPIDPSGEMGKTSPHDLAARLSYLLWLSPPDQQLSRHAVDGSLLDPKIFRSEAERLLADPRSRRFLDCFCRQWLRLDKHENVAVDRRAYPQYDDELAAAAISETLAYFGEVFNSNASALDLIDSDYAVLNNRLADHYGVEGVTSGDLTRTTLPDDSIRGGLLTQASLMTINSDGIDSHPIRRGAWLLDRVLNRPPPPPPPNVPDLDGDDPDLRGLSLQRQIERHRQPGSCRDCHQKIDPWGIPFENLDATGRWRDQVKARDDDVRSRPVDAVAVLPDGQHIDGITELKGYLRRRRADQFSRSLVHHLLTYALGRSPDFRDRRPVNEIHDRFIASNYQLKQLILAIVESELFRQ